MSKYSNDLINEIKRVFPERDDMLKYANQGNSSLGRLLYEEHSEFPYAIVFKILGKDKKFDEEAFNKLVDIATKENEKAQLYLLWCKEIGEYRKQENENDKKGKQTPRFKYSKELVDKTIELYPENEEIQNMAKSDVYALGRELYEKSTIVFNDICKIVNDKTKTNQEMFAEIIEKAKNAEEIANLYSMWSKEECSKNEMVQ